MNKNKMILVSILVVSLVLPVMLSETQPVSAVYYGSVDFTGRVTIKTSEDAISGVAVKLLEDGVVKCTDTTDSNGNYSFTWTIVRFKLYTMKIEKSGYRDQSTWATFPSSTHNKDFEIDGRVALFMWASDATNETVMEEYGDYLVDYEGFSDILYREDQEIWEDSIDDVDDLETSDSLVFLYVIAHGDTTGGSDWANGGDSMVCQNTEDNMDDAILSSEFCDKIECLESENIIVIIESCDSGDFVFEYKKPSRASEDIFIIATTYYEHPDDYLAVMWFGDNYTYWDANDPPLYNSYGGAFSYYFFDNLANDYSENIAFSNANSSVGPYSATYFSTYLNKTQTQVCQLYDNLDTQWFG
ncbi:MAG: hypothetical protein GOP50_06135 [Candidatus Heimdallarchaeota archaeon]|nr:hypothetical protein [Candidatus Heimdallarchaeota archaeon]